MKVIRNHKVAVAVLRGIGFCLVEFELLNEIDENIFEKVNAINVKSDTGEKLNLIYKHDPDSELAISNILKLNSNEKPNKDKVTITIDKNNEFDIDVIRENDNKTNDVIVISNSNDLSIISKILYHYDGELDMNYTKEVLTIKFTVNYSNARI